MSSRSRSHSKSQAQNKKRVTLDEVLKRIDEKEKKSTSVSIKSRRPQANQAISEKERNISSVVSSRYTQSLFKNSFLTLIPKNSKLLSEEINSFKFKKSEPLTHSFTYKIIRSKNEYTGQKLLAKVYQKMELDVMNKASAVQNEILVHKAFKDNKYTFLHNLVNIVETPDELYLFFGRFSECGDRIIKNLSGIEKKKHFLVQILVAFIQINTHGISVCEFSPENIVINSKKYFLFNLNSLTSYGKSPSKAEINEYTPPEVKHKDEVSSKTDSWIFGVLIVYVFTKTYYPFDNKIERDSVMRSLERRNLVNGLLGLVKRCLVVDATKRLKIEEIFLDPFFANFTFENTDTLLSLPEHFRKLLSSDHRKTEKLQGAIRKIPKIVKKYGKGAKEVIENGEVNYEEEDDKENIHKSQEKKEEKELLEEAISGKNKLVMLRRPLFATMHKTSEQRKEKMRGQDSECMKRMKERRMKKINERVEMIKKTQRNEDARRKEEEQKKKKFKFINTILSYFGCCDAQN